MTKKLHILFLSSWYPSRVLPSNGDFVQRHAEAVATKHNVTLIHVISDENLKISEKKIQVINNVNTYIIYVPKNRNPLYKLILFFKTYISTIKNIKYFDVVHLNITFPVGLIALYLKWIHKKPFIISEHSTKYQPPNNISIGFIQKYITLKIIKNATFICPVSKDLERKMINLGFIGNYFSVPNVVDTNTFKPSKKDIKIFTITHVSHLGDEHKNISGILNVISNLNSKIPKFKFVLVGKNPSKYNKQLKKLEIKDIELIDEVSNKKVANLIGRSNLFILFSNYENLPCVIIESFSSGVPVISTNVGGISEYFPENFGYLINPRDEIALENSILKIYNQEISRSKEIMHKYAQDNFGIDSISEKFSSLYLKSLNR